MRELCQSVLEKEFINLYQIKEEILKNILTNFRQWDIIIERYMLVMKNERYIMRKIHSTHTCPVVMQKSTNDLWTEGSFYR